MKKEQKKILGLFIAGIVVMVSIIGFQAMQSGQVVHDPMETMDETMEMVMDEDAMTENMTEESMDKDDEMMTEESMDKDDAMMTEESMDKDDEMMTEETMHETSEMMEETEMVEEEKMMNDGPMAPEFSLMDLEGNTVSLAALKGEKVYVKFWASWCPICLSGLDEIDTLSAEMNDFKVITVVAPKYNGEQDEADFKEWFKTRNTENMTVLLDHGGEVTKAFKVRGYPTSVFIGSDGVLVQAFPGHVSSEQIKTFFEQVK